MGTRRKPIPVEIQARLKKFFVVNLPDRCSGSDLALVLRGYGTIFDIYIARKRDKQGKRFGFVSFVDVKDKSEMVKNLSAIRMGEFRLSFNVARFVLEEGEVNVRDTSRVNNKEFWNQEHGFEPFVNKEGGSNSMSFKEAFTGAAVGKTIQIDDDIVAFEDCHGRAVLVRVMSVEVL